MKLAVRGLTGALLASAAFFGPLPGPALAQTIGDPASFVTAEYLADHGLALSNAAQAYALGFTGKGVIVGVIDTGLDTSHPEFAGKIAVGGQDLLYGVPMTDRDGHGTHVAGTIAAARDGIGMHGVAFDARVIPFRSIRGRGDTETQLPNDVSATTRGIDAAVAAGARVINGSYGPSFYDEAYPNTAQMIGPSDAAEAQALIRAARAGVVGVFAAGNEYTDNPVINRNPTGSAFLPYVRPSNRDSGVYVTVDDDGDPTEANYDFSELEGMVVAVASVDRNKRISWFSNRCGVARNWCLVAFGGGAAGENQPSTADDVLSAKAGGGYFTTYGTSMASPHVAGGIAVLMEAFPGLSARDIVYILLNTAEDLGAPGVDEIYGHGLMDLGKAVRGPTSFAAGGFTTITVANGSGATFANDISGTGGLIKQGAGTLTLTGANSYTGLSQVQAGTLAVNGTVAGGVTVSQGATLRGTGRVDGGTLVAGTLAPGNSPGTLTAGGPVELTRTATLAVEIDGTGTGNGAGNHDRLIVTGTGGSFTAGGTIAPVTRGISAPATNSFTPTLGQGFTVVEAAGGVLGSFGGLTQPTSGLPAGTRFDAVYGSRTLTLRVTPARYGDIAAAGLTGTRNRNAAGGALDAARPVAGTRPDAAAQPVFDALYPLAGEAVGQALDQIGGAIHGEAMQAQLGVRRAVGGAIGDRLALLRDGSAAAQASAGLGRVGVTGRGAAALGVAEGGLTERGGAEGAGGDRAAWIRVLGSFGSIRGDGNAPGVKARTGAALVGADAEVARGVTAGLAVGYSRTDADARKGGGSVTIDGYHATLYGAASVGSAFIEGTAGYSFDRYESSRPLSFGGYSAVASGKADGHDLSASLTAGTRLTVEGVTVEPSAGLRVDRLFRSGFGERGAGLLSLSVADETLTAVRSTIGARANTLVTLEDGTEIRPSLRLHWAHDLADRGAETRAGLAAASFTTAGTRVGRDAALIGTGVSVGLSGSLALYADYGAELRRHAADHTVAAGLKLAW
ncbi:autotransporter domain-containing protein [Azospirillum thermophilum]|uniref:Autotransporter domain-containing protein n=1 Tax=Azospirillum thermophilum TaxID=2202148 RepID=A0A2S2CV18_9PROT|nr:autotransporter domain-containing protein [Azospirillum thermophilum]AWK88363.1 hypothetical protein DEW08_19950 [Azospirillum thermophilum]